MYLDPSPKSSLVDPSPMKTARSIAEDKIHQANFVEKIKLRIDAVAKSASSLSDGGKHSSNSDKSKLSGFLNNKTIPCVVHVQTATGLESAWLKKLGPQCEVTYFRDFAPAVVDRRLLREFDGNTVSASDQLASMVSLGELSFSSMESLYYKTEATKQLEEDEKPFPETETVGITDSAPEELSIPRRSKEIRIASLNKEAPRGSKESHKSTSKPLTETADSTPLQENPILPTREVARCQIFGAEDSPLSIRSEDIPKKRLFDWQKVQAECLEISQGSHSSLQDEEVVEVLGDQLGETFKIAKEDLRKPREQVPSAESVEHNLDRVSEVVQHMKGPESIEVETQCSVEVDGQISEENRSNNSFQVEIVDDKPTPAAEVECQTQLIEENVLKSSELKSSNGQSSKSVTKIYKHLRHMVDKLDKTVSLYKSEAEILKNKAYKELKREERKLRYLARNNTPRDSSTKSINRSLEPNPEPPKAPRLSKLRKADDQTASPKTKSSRYRPAKEKAELGKRDTSSLSRTQPFTRSKSPLRKIHEPNHPRNRVDSDRQTPLVSTRKPSSRKSRISADDFVLPDIIAAKYDPTRAANLSSPTNPEPPAHTRPFARRLPQHPSLPSVPSLQTHPQTPKPQPTGQPSRVAAYALKTLTDLSSRRPSSLPPEEQTLLLTELSEILAELAAEKPVLEAVWDLLDQGVLFATHNDRHAVLDAAKEKVELIKFSKNFR